MTRWIRWRMFLSMLAVVLFGCEVAPTTPASEGPPVMQFETAAGVSVEREQIQTILSRYTRSLAIALGDSPALRAEIAREISLSEFPERKLDFKRLLTRDDLPLADRLAAADGISRQQLVASSDSVPDLELYIPVEAHKQWAGEETLLVASLLSDDDGSAISAFDLRGQPVRLSLAEAPKTPTLVLNPAEIDFRNLTVTDGIEDRSNIGPALGHRSSSGALYMTSSYLSNLHEPWINGDPEIYVFLGIEDEVGGTVDFERCAGDGQSAPYYFDQNSNSWSGQVQVAVAADVVGHEYELQVWEDDWGRCDGSNNLTPHQSSSFLNDLVNSVGKAGYKIYREVKDIVGSDTTWTDRGESIWGIVTSVYQVAGAVTHDDFIGVTSRLSRGCYTAETGPVSYTLRDETDNPISANISIDDDFVDRVLCELEVQIDGPELPRDCRRLQPVRGWGYEQGEEVRT